MKKENKVALKTMAMKTRVVNTFRTLVYPYTTSEYEVKYRGKKIFSEQDKIRIFDEIYSQLRQAEGELRSYKTKRQYKAKIEAEREKRKNLELAK